MGTEREEENKNYAGVQGKKKKVSQERKYGQLCRSPESLIALNNTLG